MYIQSEARMDDTITCCEIEFHGVRGCAMCLFCLIISLALLTLLILATSENNKIYV